MSLRPCPSCSNPVAAAAHACPQCGHPLRPGNLRTGCGCITLAALAMVLCMAILAAVGSTVQHTAGAKPVGAKPNCANVDKAREMVLEARKLGIIDRLDGRVLWVRPEFHMVDFRVKEGVVWSAYVVSHCETGDKFVQLHDTRTGKQVGSFNPGSYGLKLY